MWPGGVLASRKIAWAYLQGNRWQTSTAENRSVRVPASCSIHDVRLSAEAQGHGPAPGQLWSFKLHHCPAVSWFSADTQAAVHLTMMTLPEEKSADALQIALRAARENEARWMEMSPEISADCDRMEQWASTAKLRRLEIERIETLLAEVENPSPGPTLR